MKDLLLYDVFGGILEWSATIALSIGIGWMLTNGILKHTKLKKSHIRLISIPVSAAIFYALFLNIIR